ncbi:MAG TPA: hypothetical protein VFM46_09165, partial [Pseudomonadales bacterium]|nr:hypothetical protein [Pseudomonadales bacterium]
GVFATGGHGLLGSGMGANLPRIRAMRRWSASPVFDESSLDIILKRAPDASYLSQQDAADPAEKIAPVFLTNGGDQFLMASWYPHPILRHKTGVIESLPCHSLATECLEPAAKAGSFFAGIEEWPADSSKPQSRPRVNIIAKSMSGTQQWGSISVYDGDSADVGRIVCDSSWRRFINLNITKTHPKLHQYFLNIVAWLTPKSKRDPWNRILCALAHAELNNLNARDIELEQIDWEPLIRAGTLVEEQLTRQHGPGATEELINELLRIAGASSSLKQLFSLRTSLEILKQRETLPNTLLVPRHLVRRAILGATAHSLLKTASLDYLPGTLMHTAEAQERLMRLTVKSGVRFAEQAIANFLNGALKSTRDFVQQVSPHPHEHTLSSEPVTLD